MSLGLPTAIVLPGDARLPRRRGDRPAQHEDRAPWREPVANRFVALDDDAERAAWFHFCTGHHAEFLYWEATAEACGRVVAATGVGDEDGRDRWMWRVCRLIEGSAAMLHYCADLDPATYDPCLRASMEAEREDFSGDMSRDFLSSMHAKAALVETLEDAGDEAALKEFKAAERYWHRHHGEVITALHPGSSLLREKILALQRESENFDYRAYVENVVRGEQALADYDDYFGVTRSDAMTVDDYWTQAVEKLATVHGAFAMDADTRAHLMRGDAVLLAMISEALEDIPAV